MFFCMRSVLSCSRTIGRFERSGSVQRLVRTERNSLSSQLVSELWFTKQRTRHIRTIRKNSSDIGLVISNGNDSLEIGSVVSQNECEEYIFQIKMKFFFVLKIKLNYSYLNILFVLNLDNLVYEDFAYTRHERIFEVLIYWIDIESHSSSPDMILMMARHRQYLLSSLKAGFLYISIRLV